MHKLISFKVESVLEIRYMVPMGNKSKCTDEVHREGKSLGNGVRTRLAVLAKTKQQMAYNFRESSHRWFTRWILPGSYSYVCFSAAYHHRRGHFGESKLFGWFMLLTYNTEINW